MAKGTIRSKAMKMTPEFAEDPIAHHVLKAANKGLRSAKTKNGMPTPKGGPNQIAKENAHRRPPSIKPRKSKKEGGAT